MQHREIVTRKLEQVEGKLAQLEFIVSRGTKEEFVQHLIQTKELVQDIKDYVQREPRTPGEFNN